MSKYDEQLLEFEVFARGNIGIESLMQHMAQRLHENTTRYNWVGFYLMEAPACDTLVLGPYVGSFTPTPRIPIDKGLCGAAATTGKTVVINNVAADSRYLGSDNVKSNIVVPITVKGRVMAELDVESYFADAFPPAEQKFLEACARLVERQMQRS